MTKDEYLEIRNDPKKDTSPLYFYLWELEGDGSLSSSEFVKYFWFWVINIVGIHRMSMFQYNVFLKLDKHFNIKE